MAVEPFNKTVISVALMAAALLGAGVCSPSPARADPVLCGPPQHPVTCPPQSGVPTARETAYLTDVRGHVPGDDAGLLAIGRGVCVKLLGGEPVDSVVPQVAAQMGVANETAGQVVDAATGYMCPGAPLNE